jgi:hypothetical protein
MAASGQIKTSASMSPPIFIHEALVLNGRSSKVLLSWQGAAWAQSPRPLPYSYLRSLVASSGGISPEFLDVGTKAGNTFRAWIARTTRIVRWLLLFCPHYSGISGVQSDIIRPRISLVLYSGLDLPHLHAALADAQKHAYLLVLYSSLSASIGSSTFMSSIRVSLYSPFLLLS